VLAAVRLLSFTILLGGAIAAPLSQVRYVEFQVKPLFNLHAWRWLRRCRSVGEGIALEHPLVPPFHRLLASVLLLSKPDASALFDKFLWHVDKCRWPTSLLDECPHLVPLLL
jgi:hypothetical protein